MMKKSHVRTCDKKKEDFVETIAELVTDEEARSLFEIAKSNDVQKALDRALKETGVVIRLNTDVREILAVNGAVTGVRTDRGVESFDCVVLTTGGLSYPSTGSTGAGYEMVRALGHTVTALYPSLVPLETVESWPYALSGITLKNVRLTAKKAGKTVYSEQGEMLLTHFGVSGPLVLTASAYLAEDPAGAELSIDLKPAIPEEELHARLQRLIQENPKKAVGGAFSGVLPTRLLDAVFDQARIRPWAPASSFTREQRQSLVSALKGMSLTVKGSRPFSEAVITRGGVNVKEVTPSTLESKLVSGLYLAGEILDVDAFTGGFNLQIAWSTGALAGGSI